MRAQPLKEPETNGMNSASQPHLNRKEMASSVFDELSRDELFAVMKNMVYTFNWAWLKSEREVIEEYGLDPAVLGEQFIELFREFGSRQSRKLVKLSIVSGTNSDSVIKALQLSHCSLFENVELNKLSHNIVRMRTIDCSLQRNSITKWGMKHPCKNLHFSLEWRTGFVREINPRAEVKCSYCPPDPRPENVPENVSCEWIISTPS